MKEFAQQGRSWQGKMEAGADGWVPERMLFHSFSTGEQAVRARAREGEDSGGQRPISCAAKRSHLGWLSSAGP